MPIYEFRCSKCNRRSSLLVRAGSAAPMCPHCGGLELTRLISTFAYHRSLKDVQDASGDPDRPGPDYYSDPRNIGRWVEKRFQQMGMDMPPEVQQTIQKAREGELPDSVKDLRPGVKEI
ncbi:MAG: zinc ribbon domain-containing protein [Chloroflexi bacterium]|nr:zinc ribbon domain-containing protein [Chloroflexota bacterium]